MKVRAPIQITSPIAPIEKEEGGLELGRIVDALRRRLLLIAGVTVVMAGASVLKAVTDTPIYQAGFEILTEPVTAETEVLSSVPQTLSGQQSGEQSTALDNTKIRVLRSPALLIPLVEQLQARYPELDYNAVRNNLRIQATETNVLSVFFQDENPQLVKDLLDQLSEVYLNYSLEDRQKDIRQGIVFVEEQLPKLEARVSVKQEELQQFRQRYNVVDPTLLAQQLSQQAGELSKAQLDAATQLNEARMLYESLRTELGGQPPDLATASALNANPRYQKLLDKLLEIDAQLAQDSALYLNSSPEMSVLRLQRDNLLPLLQREGTRSGRELLSRIQELEFRNRSLLQAINIINQQIKQLSVITREHTDIQRELQIATENLSQFLTKREALRIDASQQQIPWQLLTPASQPSPAASSVTRNLALGTILGLMLGVGVALLIDRLGGIIRTAGDAKESSRLPVLGIIPEEQSEQESTFMQQGLSWLPMPQSKVADSRLPQVVLSPFEEAFRSLYTNILLIDPDTSIHSLIVTSAVAESGRTTIAMNLAQASAAMGRRVLLVDADLRHPDLYEQLKLPSYKGLTDVVSNPAEDLLSVVQPIEHEPNLWVLTAGTPPPDPTRVLSSQAMEQLMRKALGSFDLVIYDTPPLLGFADVRLLSTKTDGLLLVVRLNQLKQTILQQAVEELNVSGASVLGIVANGAKSEILPYTYPRIDDSKISGE